MNKINKLISVVIPLYITEEQRLRACINSLLKQTYKEIELIIVNDGSPDIGPSICEEYAAEDSRIKIFHKAHSGVSSARNLGIDMASGDFICFIDSDDTIEFNTFEICMNIFESNKVDVVNFGMSFDKYKKGVLQKTEQKSCNEVVSLENDNFELLVQKMITQNYLVSSCNKVISASLIRKYNIKFDIKVQKQEDFIFNLQLLTNTKKIICIPQTLYHYYLSVNDSNSKRFEDDLFNKMIYVNHRIIELADKIFQEKQNIPVILNCLFYNYSICVYNAIKSDASYRGRIKEIKAIINHVEYKKINDSIVPSSIFQYLISVFARLNFSIGIFTMCTIKRVMN